MNEFLFLYRHPLVPLLFHEVTSTHPPSSQRNYFSTCRAAVCVKEELHGNGASCEEMEGSE